MSNNQNLCQSAEDPDIITYDKIERLQRASHEMNVWLDMTTKEEYAYDILVLAIESIEKQIPKQVEPGGQFIICPSCKSILGNLTYCTYCGQRVGK